MCTRVWAQYMQQFHLASFTAIPTNTMLWCKELYIIGAVQDVQEDLSPWVCADDAGRITSEDIQKAQVVYQGFVRLKSFHYIWDVVGKPHGCSGAQFCPICADEAHNFSQSFFYSLPCQGASAVGHGQQGAQFWK